MRVGATTWGPTQWPADDRVLARAWIGAALLALVWCVVVFSPWPPPALQDVVAKWTRTPVFALAVWLAWLAAAAQTASPRARRAWVLLATGFSCLLVGDVLWGVLVEITGRAPTPSIADVLYLAYYPFVLAGLVALPLARRGRREAFELVLDAAIVAVASGLAIWHLLVSPQLAQLATVDPATPNVLVAYGVADGVAVLAIAVVLVRMPPGRERLPYLLLGLSLIATVAGDVIYSAILLGATTIPPEIARLCWVVWALATALAALVAWRRAPLPDARADEPGWQPAFRHLPSIALLLTCALLGPAILRNPDAAQSVLIGGGVLAMLIAARLAFSQIENDRLRGAELARAGEARVAALVERASEAVLIVGPELDVRYASPAAWRLLALDRAVTDGSLHTHLHPDDRAALNDYVQACARGQVRHATVTVRFGGRSGPWTMAVCVLSNLLGDAAVDGIVINARDVSERHALEEQLRAQSLRDPLTDLPNRTLFFDRAGQALAHAQSGGARLALALVDLDRFHGINDGLGQDKGDQILQAAARRIGATLPRSDSVARVGGDEFGLLLHELRDEADLRARLEAVRAALAEPLTVEWHAVRLSASIGAAMAFGSIDADALRRNADVALEHARNEGGNAVEVFRSDRHGRVIERLRIEAELPRLVENDAFQLAYEPLLHTPDGTPAGLCVRFAWRDPRRDPAALVAVLAAVAGSAVVAPLGRWYVQALGLDLRALHRVLPDAGALHVRARVDAFQLRDDDMLRHVADFVQRLDVPPRQLVIEVPESALSPITGPILHGLHRMRALGLRIGLCRFGATQANFDLFDVFPFDTLSLASPLVARLGGSDRPVTLVRAVLSAARSMGMQVLAPGVRNARQLELLRELGCDLVAGEFLQRPLRFEQLLPWLGARLTATRDTGDRGSLFG